LTLDFSTLSFEPATVPLVPFPISWYPGLGVRVLFVEHPL
jgi:hypothetical protein